jgi:hypothetical protein
MQKWLPGLKTMDTMKIASCARSKKGTVRSSNICGFLYLGDSWLVAVQLLLNITSPFSESSSSYWMKAGHVLLSVQRPMEMHQTAT